MRRWRRIGVRVPRIRLKQQWLQSKLITWLSFYFFYLLILMIWFRIRTKACFVHKTKHGRAFFVVVVQFNILVRVWTSCFVNSIVDVSIAFLVYWLLAATITAAVTLAFLFILIDEPKLPDWTGGVALSILCWGGLIQTLLTLIRYLFKLELAIHDSALITITL